jgi:NADH-quinone oxidoreductase subunit N
MRPLLSASLGSGPVHTAAHAATHVAHHATNGIALPSISYLAILPELFMLGGALVLLGWSALLRKPMDPTNAASLSLLTGTAALIAGVGQWINITDFGPHVTIDASVVQDGFSAFVTILIASAVVVISFVAQGWMVREKTNGPEMHALMLVSAMGAMLMGEANDLILVFLGLEIMSIALYVLAAVGSTNLAQITDYLAHNILLHNGLLLAGMALLLVGFAFKIAAVPFHLWTPDVYQGSPSPVTGFMAAVAKTAGFAALLRVFVSSFSTVRSDWQPIIWVLAVITLLFGASVGVVQRDVKRMLSYSSINHAGFILLGLYLATARGVSGSLYYLFTYTFMVIGSFAVITVVGGLGDTYHDIDRWRGLARRQPWLAVPMIIFLLAQAGLPATTGLWAKVYVIEGVVGTPGGDALALIAMISAVIAGFFYLRLVLYMVSPVSAAAGEGGEVELDSFGLPISDAPADGIDPDVSPPAASAVSTGGAGSTSGAVSTIVAPVRAEVSDDEAPMEIPLGVAAGITICAGFTVLFGLWPSPIIDFAHAATLLIH